MPKIIVMNAGTEQMSGRDLSAGQRLLAAKTAWRSAWFADDGDIIISPVSIKSNFISYVGHTLGFDPKSVSVILPEEQWRQGVMTDEQLLSPQMIARVRQCTSHCNEWTMMPCYYTEGVAELASHLAIAELGERQFAAERGCDVLNRKSHFRQLAIGARLPLADGSITDTPTSLARAIQRHLAQTGTVIVKADNGAGGMGNITLTRGPAMPLPGSRETRQASTDTEAMAVELWKEMTTPWCQALVVEAYHVSSHMFYLEYLIPENGPAAFLNSGTIRLRQDSDPHAKELIWVGLEIPAEVPSFLLGEAKSHADRFVEVAAAIGYRGPLNIDVIATNTKELVFNEVNARWGGGSVMHALGERLLGREYSKCHILSSVRNVSSPPLEDTLAILHERHLLFNPESAEGVLVLGSDELLTNTVECLLIGPSRTRVRDIETSLLTALKQPSSARE